MRIRSPYFHAIGSYRPFSQQDSPQVATARCQSSLLTALIDCTSHSTNLGDFLINPLVLSTSLDEIFISASLTMPQYISNDCCDMLQQDALASKISDNARLRTNSAWTRLSSAVFLNLSRKYPREKNFRTSQKRFTHSLSLTDNYHTVRITQFSTQCYGLLFREKPEPRALTIVIRSFLNVSRKMNLSKMTGWEQSTETSELHWQVSAEI